MKNTLHSIDRFTSRMSHFCLIGLLLLSTAANAQLGINNNKFTRQDTLRGSIGAERSWWNVLHYDIEVQPHFESKSIEGSNTLQFRVVTPGKTMQIDLQEPMELKAAIWQNKNLHWEREGNAFHITFPVILEQGRLETIKLVFAGIPREAINPPWDGGWIWKKDAMGRPWMSVACQGLGASVWYPCKDHQSDEPDSGATLRIRVPDTLVAVGNGRLKNQQRDPAKKLVTYTWQVVNPINNYDIIPYIGKYIHWEETYQGEKGPLDCQYWVLDYNESKARKQFKQVPLMLHCFEYWMGPYPFYEDGYKLVESSHLGMEHQSAVAYGNHFMNGYLGRDLSGTGWGLKWDFIIVHESGHEWFGNNITSKDLADMWIHESFTNYSETLFTTCEYGKEAGDEYCRGNRKGIRNDRPIIGPYGVNEEGSGDMYNKGGNMIHTIRQVINDDSLFRKVLRGLNSCFYHQTVTSADIENYISNASGHDFSKVFDQYLRHTDIPVFDYQLQNKTLRYRWTNCIPGFDMPVKVRVNNEWIWLQPGTEWQDRAVTSGASTLEVDPNFYVKQKME